MAINSNFITTFLPIHELDYLKSTVEYDQNGNKIVCGLKDKDLFLVSQLSAEATSSSDAVIVSRKLDYGDLKYTINTDLCIDGVKRDIEKLSSDLSSLSSEVQDKYHELIGTISAVSIYLSNDYCEKDRLLSDAVDERLSHKADKYSALYEISSGYTIKSIEISDSVISHIESSPISDFINIDGQTFSAGCIGGDEFCTSSFVIENENTSKIEYTVNNDCMLNIDARIVETDESNPPCLWVRNKIGDNQISAMLYRFNTSGSYSGNKYIGNYSTNIPIKTGEFGPSGVRTVIEFGYENGQKFIFDERYKSNVRFTEFKVHGMVGSDELRKFVKATGKDCSKFEDLYKVRINQDGLVIAAEKAQNADLTAVIDYPTESVGGVIRTGYPQTTSCMVQKVAVRTVTSEYNDKGKAYVELSTATPYDFGTLKIGYASVFGETPTKIALSIDNKGNAYTSICQTSKDDFGLLRIGLSDDNIGVSPLTSNPQEQIHGLRVDKDGRAYIKIQEADVSSYGTIQLGPSEKIGNIFIDSVDHYAKVCLGDVDIEYLKYEVEQLSSSFDKISENFTNHLKEFQELTSRVATLEAKVIDISSYCVKLDERVKKLEERNFGN